MDGRRVAGLRTVGSRAFVTLVGVGALALASAAPAAAESASSDIAVSIEKLASPANVRAARLTITNQGPDDFIACSLCDPAEPNGHPYIGIDFWATADRLPAERSFEAPPECAPHTPSPNLYEWRCDLGIELDVGESRSVEVSYPKSAALDGVNASVAFHYVEVFYEDPDTSNNGRSVTWDDGPAGCTLKARDPQKPSSDGFKIKVLGGDAGCSAKLKEATLKIAGKNYVFVKKLPHRAVGAGDTWTVKLPFSNAVLDAIGRALHQGKTVTAKAIFTLDGTDRSVKARIR
jgi:hypothetical protein